MCRFKGRYRSYLQILDLDKNACPFFYVSDEEKSFSTLAMGGFVVILVI
jgi:hypothetical protein